MILYLEFDAGHRRGGEIYHRHLCRYLRARYGEENVIGHDSFPAELTGTWRHMQFNRRRVNLVKPGLVVVDVGSATRSLPAIRRARKLGAGVVAVVQGERRLVLDDGSMRARIVDQTERYLLERADVVIVNSRSTAALAETRGASSERTVVARPGLECGRLKECPARPPDPPTKLLFVGAGSRIKGLVHLIEAMALLSESDIELDVLAERTNEAAYWERIQNLVAAHNLGGRVRFHGFQDRESLDRFYREAHALVVPSLFEGYGMVVAEAFCYGLPVIASNVAALPELIVHDENGLLVPPADPDVLANAIRTLARDSARRDRMARANFTKSNQLPGWDDFDAVLDRDLVPLIDPFVVG